MQQQENIGGSIKMQTWMKITIVLSLIGFVAAFSLSNVLGALTVTIAGPADGSTVYNNLSVTSEVNGTNFANQTIYVYSLASYTYTLVSQTNGTTPLAITASGLAEKTHAFNASAWDTSGNRYDSETREVTILSSTSSVKKYYIDYNKDLYSTTLGIILIGIGAAAFLINMIQDITEDADALQ
jgi:hypothetical protein